MSRAKGRAASGFRPTLPSRAESLSLESLDMSCAVGRESLDIPKFGRESLDMDRESLGVPKFGRESLDMGRKSLVIPKIGRESLDMGRKSLDTGFRDPCPDLDDQILVFPDFRDPCPDFRDQNSVCPDFRRLKLSERLCTLGLNPDVALPLKSEHEFGTSNRVIELDNWRISFML